jgi:tRNA pseudouridine38-40 synthase
MALWKLTLSYDGTPFHGWQVQPEAPTVQGTLAAALRQTTGETVLPQGSGRTDAGVHALAQVASFELTGNIPAGNLRHALNRALPPSIRVLSAEIAPAGFHARHSARGKSYEYRIFEQRPVSGPSGGDEPICSPFLAPYVWACPWPLDFDRMAAAAGQLTGTHDFSSFAASDPDRSHREDDTAAVDNVRTIFRSCLTREDGLVLYRVAGTGFLHHMVRNIVGTLVEIGRGAMAPDSIPAILGARDRSAAGPTAPASGLFLVSVDYDEVQP